MRTRPPLAVVAPFLLVAVLGAATAGTTLADPGDGPLGGLDLEHLQRLLHRAAELLELTPAQRAEIALILADELPGIRDLASRLAAARRDYWSSHDLGDLDEGEYRAFLESQSPLEIELRVAGVRTMSRLWNVLDPEQQQRLLRLIRALGNGPRHGDNRVAP
jgi:Spy/CpxP family protein refolding chaperone